MSPSPDPEHTRRHYDAYGLREWERFDRSPMDRTNLLVHLTFVAAQVREGDLVLDIGAAPGRFTIEMARLGARVHVGGLSPVQLQLNREKVAEAGFEGSVVAREALDVCDLSKLAADSFDVVVCFGGPVSYAMNSGADALAQLSRVTRPGGIVLLSVMSLVGSTRRFLPGVLAEGERFGPDVNDAVLRSGDLMRSINGHECHMYRWAELRELVAGHGELTQRQPRTS